MNEDGLVSKKQKGHCILPYIRLYILLFKLGFIFLDLLLMYFRRETVCGLSVTLDVRLNRWLFSLSEDVKQLMRYDYVWDIEELKNSLLTIFMWRKRGERERAVERWSTPLSEWSEKRTAQTNSWPVWTSTPPSVAMWQLFTKASSTSDASQTCTICTPANHGGPADWRASLKQNGFRTPGWRSPAALSWRATLHVRTSLFPCAW